MSKTRLEAFSDGVIAILITIMVLELKVPHESTLEALQPLWHVFVSYVLSFIFIGIYWNNHHHLMHAVDRVNGAILWANLHLLFWLSLIPFVTAWMGEHAFASAPTALYGGVLLFSAVAYTILTALLVSHHGKNSTLARAMGADKKGKLSLCFYVAAIPLAFKSPALAYLLYCAVAAIWLIPDRRIEKILMKH